MKYILAFDHGTSGMKASIVSTRGDLIGFAVDEYELFHYEPGCAEQSPTDWWNALIHTTHELLARKLVPIDDITAIITSNQMDGTIPIDKIGNPLHNCIIWMDTRGAPMIARDFGGILAGYNLKTVLYWLDKTGGAPGLSGKDIIGHILWLKEVHPEIYQETWKLLDCKDYLNFRLTGQIATSYDCGILTWLVNDKDPNNVFYDPLLLQKTHIDSDKLPPLFPSTHILGSLLPEIAQELGISATTKVVLGAGDINTAAIGSGAILDNQCHICIGSSSWVVAHHPIRKVDTVHMIGSLPSAIPGRYILLGEQESAGIALSWLRNNILYHKDMLLSDEQKPDVYKIFDSIVAEVPPGSNKVIFTPWLFGERAPVEDHTVRGGLFNLGLNIDRRHILRAIYEGVAMNSRWVFEIEEKMTGSRFESINLIGGGATSDIWCQIYADILNRPINQIERAKEANSIGAAFIASVALGEIQWDEIAQLVHFKHTYFPQPENRKIYDELFKEFVRIYYNNRKMYRRLNRF